MNDWKAELCRLLPGKCLKNEPLASYATYKIGGNAEMLVLPGNKQDLVALLDYIRSSGVEVTYIGLGSNLLISDSGIPGIVCSLRNFTGIEISGETVRASSGTPLDEVVAAACSAGLGGMEKLSGIPGSVGGAVWMNAGAFEQETFDCLEEFSALDSSGAEKKFYKKGMSYGYRRVDGINGYLVTEAVWRLTAGDVRALEKTRNDILSRRAAKQPLEYPSAGSVFKRPHGDFASRLIDAAGLKGLTVGGAQVSPKHAGFIVNVGGATAADVYALIRKVQMEVKAKTGVSLELEQILLGRFPSI